MNTPSILKRITISIVILAGVAVLASIIFTPPQTTQADEARLILENNDILSLSETVGAKNLTNLGNVKFLFDEKDGFAVFGQGWGNITSESELTGGTQLWLLNMKTNQKKQLIKEFEVTEAVLGNNGIVYYATRDQDLFVIDQKGAKRKLKEKVLQISISNDGKIMVYQKLPQDWSAGDYYDSALGITILDLDTLTEARIANKADDWGAFLSPDAKKIIFISNNEYGIAGFSSMSTNGTNKVRLTNINYQKATNNIVPLPSERPIFSPDGKYLTFESDRTIWLMEFNETYDKILQVKRIAYGIDPKFSNDNKYISTVVMPTENSKRAVIQIDVESALKQ